MVLFLGLSREATLPPAPVSSTRISQDIMSSARNQFQCQSISMSEANPCRPQPNLGFKIAPFSPRPHALLRASNGDNARQFQFGYAAFCCTPQFLCVNPHRGQFSAQPHHAETGYLNTLAYSDRGLHRQTLIRGSSACRPVLAPLFDLMHTLVNTTCDSRFASYQ